MTPLLPAAQRPRHRTTGRAPLAVGLVALALLGLAALAVLTLAVALPRSGGRIPGARRIQAVLEAIPQPWKAPRPAYVAPPEGLLLEAPVIERAAPAVAPPAAGAVAPALPDQAAVETAPAVAPVAVAPLARSARLEGIRHQWQTWNNCGPATITMATSYFGRTEAQAHAAAFLKPNADDKNVGPDELVSYARSLGLHADWRVAGDLDRLKRLIANGVPVIVGFWHTPKPNDGLGHYRLLIGYDDDAARFIAYDSFIAPGVNLAMPYEELGADWRVYNRQYIPVYSPEKAGIVAQIVGADADHTQMHERALAIAQDEAAAQPADPYAWFNIGTNLVALGRPAEAVPAFDRARALKLPWRLLWYQFGPFEAYLAAGRLGDVLTLAEANLAQTADLEESHYYRGRALQAQGQAAAARGAYQTALRVNPKFAPASHALSTLGA